MPPRASSVFTIFSSQPSKKKIFSQNFPTINPISVT